MRSILLQHGDARQHVVEGIHLVQRRATLTGLGHNHVAAVVLVAQSRDEACAQTLHRHGDGNRKSAMQH
jgi:hypothetical protein